MANIPKKSNQSSAVIFQKYKSRIKKRVYGKQLPDISLIYSQNIEVFILNF
jgi:hypothetical protein